MEVGRVGIALLTWTRTVACPDVIAFKLIHAQFPRFSSKGVKTINISPSSHSSFLLFSISKHLRLL